MTFKCVSLVGIDNTSFGLNALNPALSGVSNSAFGSLALTANTTGSCYGNIVYCTWLSNVEDQYDWRWQYCHGHQYTHHDVFWQWWQPYNTYNIAIGSTSQFNTNPTTIVATSSGKRNTSVGASSMTSNTAGTSHLAF